MKILITGGCGFSGSNLAANVLKNQIGELFIFDNMYRQGSYENLTWLRTLGSFKLFHADIRINNDISRVIKEIKPDVVFHLAGQVAMTTSIDNPRLDFEVNVLGSFNLLEAIKNYSLDTAVLFSSTNKVYGDLEWVKYIEKEKRYCAEDFPNGFSEKIPLDFSSPYGCSKGSADQYMLDYYRIFNVKSVVFRHSSIYGGRQFSTFDQGWIGWFCQKSIETKKGILKEPFTISGNGKQVRDVLYADDMVKLYLETFKNIEKAKGNVFNIGGGMNNSLSLLELFDILEELTDTKLNYIKLPARECDQKIFVADISKAKRIIGWEPIVDKKSGIIKMLDWVNYNAK